ncbi:MAG: hypothetical protein H7Z12_20150 [Rhodospirillaceae bacterium]|nr:hypothetical protein [Rhodospirillales bacterium]
MDEDLDYARSVRKELRATILGEELGYADAVEAIVPGASSAVNEIQRMMARLDSGQHLAPSELSMIAQHLAKLHDTLADQPAYAQATLDVRVKLALSIGDRDLACALRPEIARRADLPGRTGIELVLWQWRLMPLLAMACPRRMWRA